MFENGLLGTWQWLKGNEKCRKCDSYDTVITDTHITKSWQEWRTDWAQPQNKSFVRPQVVFNNTISIIVVKCKDCDHSWADSKVSERRA